MSIHEEIDAAILAHLTWIKKIKTTVALSARTTNSVVLDQKKHIEMIENVQSDENCKFGIWLHKIVTPELKCVSYFDVIQKLHQQFHQEAAEIITLSLNGKSKKAQKLLTDQASFTLCSSSLIEKLEEWKNYLNNDDDESELIFLDFD